MRGGLDGRRVRDDRVGGGILGVPVKYTSNTFTAAAPASYTITFTLPSGVNFANNPSATGDGTNFAATLSQVSGGVGNNFISFTGTANAVAAVTGTVTLGSFNVTGATALATTNTTNFQMTASVSSTIAALNDTGSKGQLAASASVVQFTTFPSASLPLVIDITPGNLGAKFLQSATNSTVGDQGDAVIVVFSLANAADTATCTPPSTANLVLTGSWGGISSPFLLAGAAAPATSCPATAPAGAVTGTVTGSTITFPNVVLPTLAGPTVQNYEVCLASGVTPGRGVIASNVTTTVSLSATGATLVVGGTATGLDGYTYNGSVQQLLYSGVFPPYQAFVRVTNNTGSTANPTVVVQPDTGTSGLNTAISVPGNTNQLIAASSIVSGSGVTLDSTGRVSMLFLTPGAACANNGGGQACAVSVSGMLVNPNGVVVPLGSGAAP
jgi:hypothetical protein